jgi:hypothetical protein
VRVASRPAAIVYFVVITPAFSTVSTPRFIATRRTGRSSGDIVRVTVVPPSIAYGIHAVSSICSRSSSESPTNVPPEKIAIGPDSSVKPELLTMRAARNGCSALPGAFESGRNRSTSSPMTGLLRIDTMVDLPRPIVTGSLST